MSRSRTFTIGRSLMTAAGLALALPALAAAQGGPGFLFRQPTVTLRFETGYGVQLAKSEIFDFVRDSFDLGGRDFNGPYLGAEVAYRVNERVDVALGVGVVQSEFLAEDRRWEDTQTGLPLEQYMHLRVVPITVSGKYYFNDRGRRVGRFAWVPAGFTPYVGAGVGVVAYDFSMTGDFVDTSTFEIFYDDLSSSGEAGLIRLLGGATVSLGRQFELSGEARFTAASAKMSRDFDGFEPLDLNGFQGVIGIGIRF